MPLRYSRLFACIASLALMTGMLSPPARGSSPPAVGPSSLDLRSPWVDSVLASMTLQEKIGQMVMVRVRGNYISTDNEEFARLERLARTDGIGGLLMQQGDVYETAILLNRVQAMAKVPMLIAADYERGVAMRVRRATPVPDAMALGATRDTLLAYEAGRMIALEARAVGVHQNFAPVVDINDNPENPVINTRSFGDDRDLVAAMASSFIRGTNDGGAVSTAKHFPGHGSTGTDSHIELPVVSLSRARLDSVELFPFRRAVASGVLSVMTAHLAVPAIDSGANEPASLSPLVVESLLQGRIGFRGLVVTDGLEMQAVTQNYSASDAVVHALRAGADILLEPVDEEAALNAIFRLVRGGAISEERITGSVRKILALKQWLGLDKNREVDIDSIAERVATAGHRLLAKEIARRSITVLRNEGKILPLRKGADKRILLVAIGDREDDLIAVNRPGTTATVEPVGAYLRELMSGRFPSVEFRRVKPGRNSREAESIVTQAQAADLLVIALCVTVRSGSGSVGIPGDLEGFVRALKAVRTPTVVLSLGNPYLVKDFPRANAVLCAYSDAEMPVEAAVEALTGEIHVDGRLPVTISSSFPFGAGLELPKTFLRSDDPEVAGFDRARLRQLSAIVRSAERDSAFPGAQVVVVKNGILAYNKSFGTLSYDPVSREVNDSTRFDLASLTKVVATTTAVMKLYDGGRLSLDDLVSSYIPKFSGGAKDRITLRNLLTHRGGLPPFRRLWEYCPSPQAALDSVYATPLVATPGDSTIYSDLGMIIMGKVVEKVAGMSLAAYLEKEFFGPLGMHWTGFNPPESERARTAPTELDTVWRKRLVQGTVHDENAAFLGGISGHAGLFSTATDLAVFVQMLLDHGVYGGRRYIEDSTVRLFTQRISPGADRALGWDLQAPEGSSAGTLFSPSSFGHTGFTGTSIWIDPTRNLGVILLTNRVCPTRANYRIALVRPALHDAVIKALTGDEAAN